MLPIGDVVGEDDEELVEDAPEREGEEHAEVEAAGGVVGERLPQEQRRGEAARRSWAVREAAFQAELTYHGITTKRCQRLVKYVDASGNDVQLDAYGRQRYPGY